MSSARLLRFLSVALPLALSCSGSEGSPGPDDDEKGGNAGSSGNGSESGAGDAGSGGLAGEAAGGKSGAATCAFDVAASISPTIPTVGIVEWSTDLDELLAARIEFGLDTQYGMIAPVELEEPSHRTLLLGMKASRTYHFRVVAHGREEACSSDDFTLTTGPLPNGIPPATMLDTGNGSPAGGFLVSCFLQEGPAFILDRDGDYVWWFGSGPMGRATMSHDGKYLWYAGINLNGGIGTMKRVSLDGLVAEDFSAEFADLHHDFTVLPDETVAFIQHDGERDRVMEREPDGSLREVFDVASAHGGTTMNHANSIDYSADDDAYTVSDLNQDAYVKVTRQREVVWVLGGNTSDFSGDGASWEAQHGHHVLAPDRLLFFSNGPFAGPSLALEVTLDLSTMTATRVWEYESGERSIIFGDVERLWNGNTLVTYSSSGIIHEVSPNGALVKKLSWDVGGALGYVKSRASLYGPPSE